MSVNNGARDFSVTPYKLCVSILITAFNSRRESLTSRQSGKMCLFLLNLVRQSEYSFRQLCDLIESYCTCEGLPGTIKTDFEDTINSFRDAGIHSLFDVVTKFRDSVNMTSVNMTTNAKLIDKSTVAGLYLRKVYIYYDKMNFTDCTNLYNDLIVYLDCNGPPKRRKQTIEQQKQTSAKVFKTPYKLFDFNSTHGSSTKKSIRLATTPQVKTWQTPRAPRSSPRVASQRRNNLRPPPSSQLQTSFQMDIVGSQAPTTAANYGSQFEMGAKNYEDQTGHDIPTQLSYLINHQIACLQANEQRAHNPHDLYQAIKRPADASDLAHKAAKSDTIFLRYLNLLRVNEFVASKQLLMAYFDGVSDNVSRSYSALNCSIWYFHFGHHQRAIECLQECFCCAQAADDEKCLLISLMWLARIVIASKQKKSSKYNVYALLSHVQKRTNDLGNMHYVQAMVSLILDQLTGPKARPPIASRPAKKYKDNQTDEFLPTAEMLAVKHSMNDVLTMNYALQSAHYHLIGASQLAALTSQVLLHFDLIEKCGDEDILLVNENTFIAIRNLAYHVWNSCRNLTLVCEILVELCSNRIPKHRTDHHSIWRLALAEISFEYYLEEKNWAAARETIDLIQVYDYESGQLRLVELVKQMSDKKKGLCIVNELITRIDNEIQEDKIARDDVMMPSEHKAYIKSKALLLRASLMNNVATIFECLQFVTVNKFYHVRTACLMELARYLQRVGMIESSSRVINSIMIDILSNGTFMEQREANRIIEANNKAICQ